MHSLCLYHTHSRPGRGESGARGGAGWEGRVLANSHSSVAEVIEQTELRALA